MDIRQQHSANANHATLATLPSRLATLLLWGIIGLLLYGCGTQVVREVDNTPPEQIAFEQSESQLLDIGIAVFDPNVPEDYDESVEQIILPEIRQAKLSTCPTSLKIYFSQRATGAQSEWSPAPATP